MFDTVNFMLSQSEAGGVDFLSEIPCYLENVGEHSYSYKVIVTGNVGGLKVRLNENTMKVGNGSLCKWYLGDNYKTPTRGDTQRAIEKLSDTLHVPMGKATVTRLDLGRAFIMRYPPEVYLNHFGELQYTKRLQAADGLYYTQKKGMQLCFYDKNKEQREHGEPIPEMYAGRNVLRYEQRYNRRIAANLKVCKVTGAMLYDEGFYISLLNLWRDKYNAIQKINDVSLNFCEMRTKQQLYRMGVLSLIEKTGGQTQMLQQISEAQKRGELSKKQAYDLRQVVNDVCKARSGLTVPNEAIQELDAKIKNAVKYYR